MKYKYKYQEQELQTELGLNWYAFKYRNYNPEIGRFMSVDTLAEKYSYNSTYAFQENKMGLGRELEGLELSYTNPDTGDTVEGPLSNSYQRELEEQGFSEILFTGSEMPIDDEVYGGELDTVELTSKKEQSEGNDKASINKEINRVTYISNLVGETAKVGTSIYATYKYKEGLRYSAASNSNYLLKGRNLSLFKNAPSKPWTTPRFKLSGIGKFLGTAAFFVGVRIDYKEYKKGNISKGKFWTNTSVGAYGLTLVGAPAAIMYFGLENFYPGGFFQAYIDHAEHVKNYNELFRGTGVHFRTGGGY